MLIGVKHYNNAFSSSLGSPHHFMLEDFGESNTDITSWRPEISITRAQAGINSGKQLVFDFPDGVDTHEYIMTYIRNKSLDITEVDALIDKITSSQQARIDSAKTKSEKESLEKSLHDNIQAIRDAFSSSSDTNSLTSSEVTTLSE